MYAPNVTFADCPFVLRAAILSSLALLTFPASWVHGDRISAANASVGGFVSVSAASFEKAVAPDTIVAGFGINLTSTTQAANTIPLPLSINNLAVEVNGRSASLLFISPTQINYLLPDDLTEGTGQVLVKQGGVLVAAGEIDIRAGAPSVFMANTDVQGPPAANLIRVRGDGSQVLESAAQFDGTKGRFVSRVIDLDAPNELVFLILYLTGTSKDPQPGDYRVLLGGNECRPEFMTYVGPAPGFAGLKQINLNLGGCIQRLRGEDAGADFTGAMSIALADIRNAGTSNIFELEFAPPFGAPPRITGLNKAMVLAGEVLEIQGSALAETTAVYMTDSNGKRFNAQIERPVTQTNLRVRVPFGAGTGTVTAATPRGESTFPLQMRTSISGVVQIAELQSDGSYKRSGVRNVSIRLLAQNAPPAVVTSEDGSFQIPDVSIPGGAQMTVALMSVDAETAGLPNIKRTEKMPIFVDRDNEFPGYLELRAATGPSVPTGPDGALLNEAVRATASARRAESGFSVQTGEVVFDPNGSMVRFPDGTTVDELRVTVLDPERTPADLPAGQFSSTIVQLTPFGAGISLGGKLTFPNRDGLAPGSDATLYRYDQTPGSETLGQFVAAGNATVSADGMTIETGPRAVIESTYYFVSVPRPLTTLYGSVREADGQPARAAKVQVRGQSIFALTDVSGGFLLRNVPVVGAELTIEVSYLRADGTVSRTERTGVVPRVGTTAVSPPIVLPDQGDDLIGGKPPVLSLPKSLVVEAGKSTDLTFLAYAQTAGATLLPLQIMGVSFASILSTGNDRFVLRLQPTANAAGDYLLTVSATDSDARRTEATIALEVTAPVGDALAAVSQAVTTDEDEPVAVTLQGSGGNMFRIVNAPRQGVLGGTPPTMLYTPNANFNGTDDFSYTVGNATAESAPAVVTISVRPVDDPPRLDVGASFRTNIGQLLRVVINGFDPDAGQTLTLTSSMLPAGARIERATATSWVLDWRPTSLQIGSYNIGLTLRDDGTPSLSDSRAITITVDASWTPGVITGGPLILIQSLAATDEAILAGTSSAGIHRSLDNGVTWSEASTGLAPGGGQSVQALAVSGGAILAGTNGLGIYRSLDNGATWTESNSGFPNVFSVRRIYSLVVHGGAVFAGSLGGGIYRSLNNGVSWSEVNTGLPEGDARRVFSLTANGNTILAGTEGEGVYRSTNNGATWSAANTGLPTGNGRIVPALASGNGVFIAGTDGAGIYRSTDNGATWNAANTGLPAGNARFVLCLSASGGVIFAGTDFAGIYRSTDNGATWGEANTGVPDTFGSRIVNSLVQRGGLVLAGMIEAGIYRSSDNGASWGEASTGLPAAGDARRVNALTVSDGAIIAGTDGAGLYRSLDNGASLNVSNGMTDDFLLVLSLATSGGNVFGGTLANGIYRSVDNGATWQRSSNGLVQTINGLTVRALVASGQTLFAGTLEGIYRSTNNGSNWSAANNGLPASVRNIRTLAAGGGAIFAGTEDAGIFRSLDNGANWSAANNGLPNFYNARSVRTLLVTDGTVFAGTFGSGIYRSTDNGASWNPVNTGLPEAALSVRALVASGGAIFAGTFGAGVYRSTDNGASWSQVNTGLQGGRALFVVALTTSGGTIFAGTNGAGTFALAESAIAWERRSGGLGSATVNAAATDGDAVLAGTYDSGVFRSLDDGLNWMPASAGLPPDARVQVLTRTSSGTFAGLLGAGVYFTSNQGQNWSARNNGLTNLRVRALANDGATLWAGTEAGVFGSNDQGMNWMAVNTGLADLRVLSLAVAGNTIYAGTENGLFRSFNGGANWTAINTGLGSLYILSLGVAPQGGAILAGTANGLYRSTNSGGNWSLITNGISDRVVALVFAAGGTRLLVGTFFGYYVSEDQGASWQGRNTGLFSLQVGALAVKGENVFAGTRGAGVFVSRLE